MQTPLNGFFGLLIVMWSSPPGAESHDVEYAERGDEGVILTRIRPGPARQPKVRVFPFSQAVDHDEPRPSLNVQGRQVWTVKGSAEVINGLVHKNRWIDEWTLKNNDVGDSANGKYETYTTHSFGLSSVMRRGLRRGVG